MHESGGKTGKPKTRNRENAGKRENSNRGKGEKGKRGKLEKGNGEKGKIRKGENQKRGKGEKGTRGPVSGTAWHHTPFMYGAPILTMCVERAQHPCFVAGLKQTPFQSFSMLESGSMPHFE
jgi:hypothetical protein